MPESIENYVPQNMMVIQKRQAVWVWAVTMAIVSMWVLAIVSAPIFADNGIKAVSQPIYLFFSSLCHQISSRSFHYHEYQLAVCARCLGFYGGFLLGFVVYPLVRELNNTD